MSLLSLGERLILLNQYDMLAKMFPEHAEAYKLNGEIVERGYEVLYDQLRGFLPSDPLPSEVSTEVFAILDMHRAFSSAYQKDGRALPANATFEGFDGNNESDHFHFAKFFRRDMGRYGEQAAAPDDAHMPTLDRYRRMLRAFNAVSDKHNLTTAEVDKITAL